MIHREEVDAVVVDQNDPEKRGRIKVRAPSLLGKNAILDEWVEPLFPIAYDGGGFFAVPAVGAKVTLSFVAADTSLPMPAQAFLINPDYRYIGCFFPTKEEIPNSLLENYPDRLGFADSSGNAVLLDRSTAEVILHYNRLKLGSESASDPIVLGNELLAYLSALKTALVTFGTALSAVDGPDKASLVGPAAVALGTALSGLPSETSFQSTAIFAKE